MILTRSVIHAYWEMLKIIDVNTHCAGFRANGGPYFIPSSMIWARFCVGLFKFLFAESLNEKIYSIALSLCPELIKGNRLICHYTVKQELLHCSVKKSRAV